MDKVTLARIETAHPVLRDELRGIYAEIDAALTGRAKCRFTHVLRTYAEQNALYAQGRTTPGPRVTNARGGYSYHNFGLAVDFCLIIDGRQASWDVKRDWDDDLESDWMEVVSIFKAHGWEWGGDWKSFIDMPHFQKVFGKTTAQLRAAMTARDTYPAI